MRFLAAGRCRATGALWDRGGFGRSDICRTFRPMGWVDVLARAIRTLLGHMAVTESQEGLQYLSYQLQVVQTHGLKEALVNLAEIAQRKAMLAHVQKA